MTIPPISPSGELLAPFAEKEYISSPRAQRILGISGITLSRLAASGCIEWVNYKKSSWKRVRYHSVVQFCDRLRDQHKIADRRPKLSAPYLRHRDVDLLPFPLTDTTTAEEACAALGYARVQSVVNLIEEGCFEAYQLVQLAPWRISRSSLQAFIQKSRGGGSRGPAAQAYKVPTTSPHF
jgi:hypothetical protein